jgi:hypothetical protein
MEVNGVANIKILVEQIEELASHGVEVMPEALAPLVYKINEQLALLERYMLAYNEWAKETINYYNGNMSDISSDRPPYWHEVKKSPQNYPTGEERLDAIKKRMGIL